MDKPDYVIGIGMPKTGTNSLHEYLKKLGYRSYHDKSKAIKKIQEHGTNNILDLFPRFNAFSDYPFNLYYRQIEEQYPNAVFIWTTRPRDSWIESWKKHDKRMSGSIKRLDYFLKLYDQHQIEIPEYFKDKQHKFLQLDLFEDNKAEKISKFLGFDKVYEYPHLNKRR